MHTIHTSEKTKEFCLDDQNPLQQLAAAGFIDNIDFDGESMMDYMQSPESALAYFKSTAYLEESLEVCLDDYTPNFHANLFHPSPEQKYYFFKFLKTLLLKKKKWKLKKMKLHTSQDQTIFLSLPKQLQSILSSVVHTQAKKD